MSKYEININEALVTEFNEESKDWSGSEYFKSLDETIAITTDNLNKELIKEKFKESDFFWDTKDLNLALSVPDGLLTRTEDNEGAFDENGKYLVDYFFTIRKIEDVDLKKIVD